MEREREKRDGRRETERKIRESRGMDDGRKRDRDDKVRKRNEIYAHIYIQNINKYTDNRHTQKRERRTERESLVEERQGNERQGARRAQRKNTKRVTHELMKPLTQQSLPVHIDSPSLSLSL